MSFDHWPSLVFQRQSDLLILDPVEEQICALTDKLESLAIPLLSTAIPVHSRFELAQMYSPRLSVVYYSFEHPDTVDKGV